VIYVTDSSTLVEEPEKKEAVAEPEVVVVAKTKSPTPPPKRLPSPIPVIPEIEAPVQELPQQAVDQTEVIVADAPVEVHEEAVAVKALPMEAAPKVAKTEEPEAMEVDLIPMDAPAEMEIIVAKAEPVEEMNVEAMEAVIVESSPLIDAKIVSEAAELIPVVKEEMQETVDAPIIIEETPIVATNNIEQPAAVEIVETESSAVEKIDDPVSVAELPVTAEDASLVQAVAQTDAPVAHQADVAEIVAAIDEASVEVASVQEPEPMPASEQ